MGRDFGNLKSTLNSKKRQIFLLKELSKDTVFNPSSCATAKF